MTKIDFCTHIVDKAGYACRWVQKAYTETPDRRIILFSPDKRLLGRLDEMLWTFSDADFLPHAILGEREAAHSPIILASDDSVEMPHYEVLVNLSSAIPRCYARFDRLVELVSTDNEDTVAGRKRYVYYRERGYMLHHESAT